MGYTLTFSAPPALQGFAAYYGGQQAAERQTQDTQARIDAQNDAQLNSALAGLTSGIATGGLAGYYYNQAQQAAPGTYAADGMGPPAPGDPAAYQRNMMLAQYALGGPQAASGYLANQEQFRNRMIAQNDAQSFSGEQNRLNREQNQTQFDARLKFRENDREDSQQFQQDYLQQQFAGKLGTTTAGLYDTGVQSVIAQGGDPATMSREQIMGIGMQTVQQQNQVRDLTNRQVFSGIQQQQGQIAQNTKPVYSPQQKQRVVQLQNAAANLQSDPKYFNSTTGTPTPLGLAARQRIQAELNSIQPRMEYQEPPPNIGQRMGFYQDAQLQGPPAPGQGSPTQRQFAPGIKAVVGDSPFGARVYYEDGSWSDYTMKDGMPTPIRWGDAPEPTQQIQWPEGKGLGQTWVDNGGVYTRNRFGEVDRLGDAPETTPNQNGYKRIFGGEDRANMLDKLSKGAPKVVMGEDENGKPVTRDMTLEERNQYAVNQLAWIEQQANPMPAEIYNQYQDVLQPGAESQKAPTAIKLVREGYLDINEVSPALKSAMQQHMISQAQNAASNQKSQVVQRRFKKTPDGPTYVGDYNPTTGKITNERLLKQ